MCRDVVVVVVVIVGVVVFPVVGGVIGVAAVVEFSLLGVVALVWEQSSNSRGFEFLKQSSKSDKKNNIILQVMF